ncbi:MAG: response regulator [Ignavibacteriae bacterium]|nr:MAG: response regulator [Ignavibacteriota bacterium]
MSSDDNKSVLIVDDDPTIRKLISHHLSKNNFKIFVAKSAKEGFEHLNNQNINLVLCDVSMDEMDGYTFCQKVRGNENHRMIPFVFVTAKTTLEDKSKAMDVGGDDIITKPFDVEELLIKVRSLIHRSDIYKMYGVKKELGETFEKTSSKIVLIDDNDSLAKLFQYSLNREGFDCEIAVNGETGLQLIKSFHPDVIVSDISMPVMDGFRLRKILLEDPELKLIPFIFLSARGEEQDLLDGYELDITDYVVKTAGPKVIVAKVSAIIKSLNKERQKVISELHQAADVMRVKVVPENYPEFEKFSIKHWHVPYRGIPGGDFIDYLQLDENHFAVVLGDVMGKKWGAWYFAFAYAGYIRSALRSVLETGEIDSPGKILAKVNQAVYKDAKVSEVFATLSVLILDNKNMVLKYSGAGDLPLFYKNAYDGSVSKIKSDGMLLGFAEDNKFEDLIIELNLNDSFVVTTDGLIESWNAEEKQYGTKRLIELLSSTKVNEDLLTAIQKDFNAYTNEQYEDDLSVIILKAE